MDRIKVTFTRDELSYLQKLLAGEIDALESSVEYLNSFDFLSPDEVDDLDDLSADLLKLNDINLRILFELNK